MDPIGPFIDDCVEVFEGGEVTAREIVPCLSLLGRGKFRLTHLRDQIRQAHEKPASGAMTAGCADISAVASTMCPAPCPMPATRNDDWAR